MKRKTFMWLLFAALVLLTIPYCRKLNSPETKTEKKQGASLNGATESSRLNINPTVADQLKKEMSNLDGIKQNICSQVDQLSSDVTRNLDGTLSYPNWVRFTQIAQQIDALNDVWNAAYRDALNDIINTAIASGATDVAPGDEQGKDFLSDEIEEQYMVYPEDMASECFENKFNFSSMRKCLKDQEDAWLETTDGTNFDAGASPTIKAAIDDEEYWTLITCNRGYTIQNHTVDRSMFGPGDSDAKINDVLTTIGDIVTIIGDIVTIGKDLHDLLKDCAGSTKATVRDYSAGITIPGENSYIGYKMVQKGVTFDFTNDTRTKIKGKAKLYRIKRNGRGKRDRRNRASIAFCAKEWNHCDGGDWPSDPGNYVHLHQDGAHGRVTAKQNFSMALTIERSYHFLQFKFGKNGILVQGLNLFGNATCTEW